MAKNFSRKDIWDRSKDGSRRAQRSFVRFAIVSTAIFVIFMLTSRNNLIRWVQTGLTIKGQERQIEQYRRDISSLERKIEALSSNRDSLETFAREKLLFSETGDDVYVIKPQ